MARDTPKGDLDLDSNDSLRSPFPGRPRSAVAMNISVPSRYNYEPESPRSNFQGSDDDSDSNRDDDMEIDENSNVHMSDGQVEIIQELSTAQSRVGGDQEPSYPRKKRNIAPFARDWISGDMAVQKQNNKLPHPRDWIGGDVEQYLGRSPYRRSEPRWERGTEPDPRPNPKYGGGKKEKPIKQKHKKTAGEMKHKNPVGESSDGWNAHRNNQSFLPDSIPFPQLLKNAGLNIEDWKSAEAQDENAKATEAVPLTSLGEIVGHIRICIPAAKYGGIQDLRVSNLQKIVPGFWPAKLRTTEKDIYFDFDSDKKMMKAAWCLYEVLLVAFSFSVELIGADGCILAFRKQGSHVPEYYDRVQAFSESRRGKRIDEPERIFGYVRVGDGRKRDTYVPQYQDRDRYGRKQCNDRKRDHNQEERDYNRSRYRNNRHRDLDREIHHDYRSTRSHPRHQQEMTTPKKPIRKLDLEKPLPPKAIVHGEKVLDDPRAEPNAKATFRWPAVPKNRRFGDPEKSSIWSHIQNMSSTLAYQRKEIEDREDNENETPTVVDVEEKFGKKKPHAANFSQANQTYVESVPDSPEKDADSLWGVDVSTVSGSASPSWHIDTPTRHEIEEFEEDSHTDGSPSPTYSPDEPVMYETNGIHITIESSSASPDLHIASTPRSIPDEEEDAIGVVHNASGTSQINSPTKRKMDDREVPLGPLRRYENRDASPHAMSPSQRRHKRTRYAEDSSSDAEQLEAVERDESTTSPEQPPPGSPSKRKRGDRAGSVEGLRQFTCESGHDTSPQQPPKKKARFAEEEALSDVGRFLNDREESANVEEDDDSDDLLTAQLGRELQQSISSPIKRKRDDLDSVLGGFRQVAEGDTNSSASQEPPKKKLRHVKELAQARTEQDDDTSES